jgi:RimJ/RimL family protein N-acetyltransferase
LKIIFRKLNPDESKKYRLIRLESLQAHPASFGSSYEGQKLLPKLMFERALEQPKDERFVVGAFDRGELIGICGFVPGTSEYFEGLKNAGTLIQMYVRSSYSGKKIGLKLTTTLIEEAFKIPGMNHIVLGVREGNAPAIRVYQQAGFQPYNPERYGSEVETPGFQRMILSRSSPELSNDETDEK